MTPAASVVMTLWREPPERLSRCLAALAGQQSLPGGLELVVATDPGDRVTPRNLEATGAIRSIRLVDNPGGARSPGLNRAVAAASAQVICRVDARSMVGPDYVARCVGLLADHPEAGVVGGVQVPVSLGEGTKARGIARALGNPWAMGGAAYRAGNRSTVVDTVYLGSFRRDELMAIGGYDERLDANEDFELCQRYRSRGMTVWLQGDLRVRYEARATFKALASQYFAFGRSKVHYWRTTGRTPDTRQLVALAAGTAAAAAAGGAALTRPRSLGPLAAGVAAGLVLLDSSHPGGGGDLATRVHALPAYVAVFGGWLAGVSAEAMRRFGRAAGRAGA